LFGTTLITVNAFLQMGSELSRLFYESLGVSPDIAPITQIFLVLIFAELSPMFAARRHSEHAALLGVPIVYFIAKLLTPLIFAFDVLNSLIHFLIGKSKDVPLFLSREEVQRALESRSRRVKKEEDSFSGIVGDIFELKNKTVKHLMLPIESAQLIPSHCTLKEMRHILSVNYFPYIPIYHRNFRNIVAIAYPRDLFEVQEDRRVIDYARSPWFITEEDSILKILKQFRRNSQSIAVVLNTSGEASGLITLSLLVDEIFGEPKKASLERFIAKPFVEKTLPGEMLVSQFNQQYGADLKFSDEEETLSDLINHQLKHPPSKGEILQIEQFEFTVIEPSLLGAKTIEVKTIQ
jgi:putative hemolysin